MHSFEPLINLLVLLSTLSIAAERLANMVKLRHPALRRLRNRASRTAEKERERLIVAHIRPDDAPRELAALARVASWVVSPTERDVIILGDLNADCDYFNAEPGNHPLQGQEFHWVIAAGTRTAVKTACAYDRIVLLDGTVGHERVPNSARVFRYDRECRISSRALVRAVSDHYPVYAAFRITGPDDDGPRRK